jgi:hypothetical protein
MWQRGFESKEDTAVWLGRGVGKQPVMSYH